MQQCDGRKLVIQPRGDHELVKNPVITPDLSANSIPVAQGSEFLCFMFSASVTGVLEAVWERRIGGKNTYSGAGGRSWRGGVPGASVSGRKALLQEAGISVKQHELLILR